MSTSPFSVITTIQQPTESIRMLAAVLHTDSRLIVVGDLKGPSAYDLEGAHFLSLADQLDSEFDLARKLPTGHYARKNVGYLSAIRQHASCIYETDDDNAPLADWNPRAEMVEAAIVGERGWINVYRLFTEDKIWPRGFPLDGVAESLRTRATLSDYSREVQAPIQQGLVNNAPDVDAIWRLTLDRPFEFECGPSVVLSRGAWCPFNTQSTWWFPLAYPLMYLPSNCSFRMTDIWRSFIAQRCLWELDLGVVFHAPEVVQLRNEHDLMRDFTDEVIGYTRNREMAAILEGLKLMKGAEAIPANLIACYQALVAAQFFPEGEVDLVRVWLADLAKAESNLS